MRARLLHRFPVAYGLALLFAIVPAIVFFSQRAQGIEFATREVKISSSQTSEVARYILSFSGQSAGDVGSIRLQLCANDPFPGQPCTAPSGLDVTAANLVDQVGMTGFTIHPATTANELVLTRTAQPIVPGTSSYTFENILNPDTQGTVFGRLETFLSEDATGPNKDAAGLALAFLNDRVSVQTTVPPYLLFCIGNLIQPFDCDTALGSYVDFGELSPTRTATGQTQMVVATNADDGYTIRALGTTMTSGVNTIEPLTSPDISRRGVSQFGMNLRANTTPFFGAEPQSSAESIGVVAPRYNSPNVYTFQSGDVLVSAPDPDNFRLFTVSYITNVSSDQAPGVYVSTLQYIATASF